MQKGNIPSITILDANKLIFLFFYLFWQYSVYSDTKLNSFHNLEKPVYRVVLDPGHGGLNIMPRSVYGDKYDPINKIYADNFRPGAYHEGIWEHEEVYKIARLIQSYLFLTRTKSGKIKFQKIMRKYSKKALYKIYPIDVYISRENSYAMNYFDIYEDINALYRLYDYPDIRTNKMKKGRISKINSYKPHLVVTIHLTRGQRNKMGALNSVITPGLDTYKIALEYAKASNQDKKDIMNQFLVSSYQNWFKVAGRDHFESFLLDACVYFTGYWCDRINLSAIEDKFKGYRHNMFSWKYADQPNWIDRAIRHPKNSQYSKNLKDFTLEGPFWQREQGREERWRREGGIEGYGGDNLYASNELLRFLRKGFLVNKVHPKEKLPQILEPYISTWSISTYVNAVVAYIEIGYLDIEADFNRILNHKKEYAESIAVGIYSLFFSSNQLKDNQKKNFPWGRKIDFKKYKNYFSKVIVEKKTKNKN